MIPDFGAPFEQRTKQASRWGAPHPLLHGFQPTSAVPPIDAGSDHLKQMRHWSLICQA